MHGRESKHSEPIGPDQLRAARKRFGKSQQECARALGIGQSSYAKREKGYTRIRKRDVVTLAHLFGVQPEEAFPPADDDALAAAA